MSRSKLSVPPLDLQAEYREISREALPRMKAVLKSGRYILGPEVEAFEKNFARLIGTKYALGVASGTDALLLSLMAEGVRPGDEIITTPFTFIATATSIARLGAKPVFVDIESDTFNLNPALIEGKITSKTKGILVVHLYGNPCRMDEILAIAKRRGLFVVEDCAQSCGSTFGGKKTGSFGSTGCFSFYPTKTLGAAGDAGVITTNDPKIYETIKSLRHHGDDGKHHSYRHMLIGINSRLDELQAALLNVKLKFLGKWNKQRRRAAKTYDRLFSNSGLRSNLKLPVETPGGESVYLQYVVRILDGRRDGLLNHLKQNGIQAGIYYPIPLHLQPCFSYLKHQKGDFPVAEQACKEVLSLPLYPQIQTSQQRHVLNIVLGYKS